MHSFKSSSIRSSFNFSNASKFVIAAMVCALLGFAHPSSAATRFKPISKVSAEKEVLPVQNPDQKFSLEAALSSLGDNFLTGVQGRIEQTVSIDDFRFEAGGSTGFMYAPSTPKGWAIPIVGEATYTFEGKNGIRPFVGLGLGVTVFHIADVTTELPTISYGGMTFGGGSVTAEGGTFVKFTALARPGFRFGETTYAEIPFGAVGGAFYAGLSFGVRI